MLSPFSTGVCVGLGVTGALGLGAGGCAYAALWPGSQIFGRALIAPHQPEELALTFDDGPNPIWTPKLLEVLDAHGIKASFFLLGSRANAEPKLVRRISEAGHLIGNHSWSHPNLALTRARKVRDELAKTNEELEQILGHQVRYFRPPFGARRPIVFKIARSLGLIPVLWNTMTSDWSEESSDRIAHELGAKIDGLVRRGKAANIVLHDGGHLDPTAARGPSVSAAGLLVARYAKTRRFVTLDIWKDPA